jgi:hypothetical protein
MIHVCTITVHDGDIHDYLGMIMTYDREKRCVKINMEKYIENIINGFKENDLDKKIKSVTTPATNNLLKMIDGNVDKFPNGKLDFFMQWSLY